MSDLFHGLRREYSGEAAEQAKMTLKKSPTKFAT
jgi:hypothetical protein